MSLNPSDLEPADVIVYCEGLCMMSVCSALDAEKTEEWIRANHPCGTEHGWKISKETHFSGGEPNPCECNSNPARKHFLFEC